MERCGNSLHRAHNQKEPRLKRYTAFLKQTWWIWSIYLTVSILLITFLSPVFIAVIPMIIVVFFYFALIRYDDDGNFIGA
jgi:uncharacterized membrane protein